MSASCKLNIRHVGQEVHPHYSNSWPVFSQSFCILEDEFKRSPQPCEYLYIELQMKPCYKLRPKFFGTPCHTADEEPWKRKCKGRESSQNGLDSRMFAVIILRIAQTHVPISQLVPFQVSSGHWFQRRRWPTCGEAADLVSSRGAD